MPTIRTEAPLRGIRVVEHSGGVAAAYAGRLLASMGAETLMSEPPTGNALRFEPPFLGEGSKESALFAYLAAGKRSVVCDLSTEEGRTDLDRLVAGADILIDDTPLDARARIGLDERQVAARHPHLVHLSVLPFGAYGQKKNWRGAEINLFHAAGEGYLLPNGLSVDLFPDRPPLKIGGHFAEMQGGVAAALAALAALWAGEGQFVDISVQDANVAVGAFAVQRFGDGSIEHRMTRSFRYGGVIRCADGYVELLTLEERQWRGLVELMGNPEWARDEALSDPVKRSAQGARINDHIRSWASGLAVGDLVARAQKLGVPMARYKTPREILEGGHEQARGVFTTVEVPGVGPVPIQSGPFRFGEEALPLKSAAPGLGADQALLRSRWPGASPDGRNPDSRSPDSRSIVT